MIRWYSWRYSTHLGFIATSPISGSFNKFCNINKIKFVFISTDQIFNKNKSFKGELLKSNPCNYYGYTKSTAEKAVLNDNLDSLVIRTNFFGYGTKYRKSFSDWIIFNIKKNNQTSNYEFFNNTIESLQEIIGKSEEMAKQKY